MPEPVSPTHWVRVKQLFRSALTLTESERPAFLAAACGEDAQLRNEVESLLGALGHAGSLVEGSAGAAQLGDSAPDPLLGRRVGPYRVLAELGRGGMGTVYCAVRDDDVFRKNVALKVLRGGLTTAFHRDSFHQERQILAGLQHPNVAQLLDGGTTDDGRPYLVMELVAGEPIDTYCQHNDTSVRARLELFLHVCAAVQCAHQNLVVHRDLKPGNILVTAEGVPKLLDFGIAKLLPAHGGAATVTQVQALTPLYASPEQLLGNPITTASDVYSLGVVLYEALTGRRPFEFEGGQPADLVRRISQDEPARPSTAARAMPTLIVPAPDTVTMGAGDTTLVAVRTAPAGRSRELRGDLDVIIMTALAKEPQRRYASVAALAEDLRRHLDGRPIAARKPTLAYRSGKFVRRHPGGVAAAAAIVVLLAGFAVSNVRQSARVARERDKAERVAAFLVELFQVADPGQARGNSITAREVLDKGAERISKDQGVQPEVRATLLVTMGNVYESLGLYERAATLLDEAVRVRRQALGPEHPDTARALSVLGAALVRKGDYERAEAALAEALRAQPASATGPALADRALTLHFSGTARFARGDYAAAEPLFREALAARRKALGPRHYQVALTLNNLANVEYEKGDYAQAESLYREALEILAERQDVSHPARTLTLHNLAGVLAARGDYDGAATLHREAVEIRTRVLGPDHPLLAGSKVSLAITLMSKNDFAGAEPLLREALEVQRRRLGPEHGDVAFTLVALGQAGFPRGDYAQVEALYREALAIQRKQDAHPDVAETLTSLGIVLDQRGDTQAALEALREALTIRRTQFGSEHIYVSLSLTALGATLRHAGDYAAAEAAYREAATIERKIESEHPNLVESLAGLASALQALGRAPEAEPVAHEAVALAGRKLPAGDARRAIAESVLGECLLEARRYAEAEALLDPAYAALRATLGERNRETRDAGRRVRELQRVRPRTNKTADLR